MWFKYEFLTPTEKKVRANRAVHPVFVQGVVASKNDANRILDASSLGSEDRVSNLNSTVLGKVGRRGGHTEVSYAVVGQ